MPLKNQLYKLIKMSDAYRNMDKPDFKSMTHQEFYEKYWLIDGKKPPPLSEFDKSLFAAFDNLKDGEQITWTKARGRHRLSKCIQDKIIKQYEKLPKFLKVIQHGQAKETNT
jgi:hypothetical protein